jgi:hypothetical protein
MALSAAFSMTMIITGVASTGGSIASLNRFARRSGWTRRVKEPLAPSGICRMLVSPFLIRFRNECPAEREPKYQLDHMSA